MASSVSCGFPFYSDGMTLNGHLGRTQHIAATFLNAPGAVVRGGVMPSGGQMAVTAGSGMAVNVAPGYAVCPSSAGSSDGAYIFGLFTTTSLAVTAADPTNPRVDLVVANAVDNGDSTDDSLVQVLTGTPTPGASLSNQSGAPAVPPNGISIGLILVPAGSTSVTAGNIKGAPTKTVAQGGILPVTLGFQPTGYNGAYMHELTSGRLMHNPASGPVQPVLLPSTPQAVTGASLTYNGNGNPQTVASVSIPTDGNTDLEIHACWRSFNDEAAAGPFTGEFSLVLDGGIVKVTDIINASTIGAVDGGSAMFHFTQGGVDRPGSGSHTIALRYSDDIPGGGHTSQVNGAELYVRAVPL